MDIFNWIYSGKVVQTPLKCWKQVTLNYDIDKKDVHICHSADHVEKESKKVTISLKRLKKSVLVLFRGTWCYDFIVSWYRNGIASKKFRRTGCQGRQGLIQSFFIEYLFGMILSIYLVWYWEGSKKMSRACVNQEDSLPARQKAVAKERKFPHYQNCFVKTLKTIRNAP